MRFVWWVMKGKGTSKPELKLDALTISHVDLLDQDPYSLLSILGLFSESAIHILRISYVEPSPTSDEINRVLGHRSR